LDKMRKIGINLSSINDLRSTLSESLIHKHNEINELKSVGIMEHSDLLVEAFRPIIIKLCGNHIFLQRRIEINLNVPSHPGTATVPHTELMTGQSPFKTILWIPLHDIEDDAGLFLYNHHKSLQFIEENNAFETPYDKEKLFALGNPPLRLKFGQGAMFNSFVLHASRPNTTSLARIALSIRFQNIKQTLSEKNLGYFDEYVFK